MKEYKISSVVNKKRTKKYILRDDEAHEKIVHLGQDNEIVNDKLDAEIGRAKDTDTDLYRKLEKMQEDGNSALNQVRSLRDNINTQLNDANNRLDQAIVFNREADDYYVQSKKNAESAVGSATSARNSADEAAANVAKIAGYAESASQSSESAANAVQQAQSIADASKASATAASLSQKSATDSAAIAKTSASQASDSQSKASSYAATAQAAATTAAGYAGAATYSIGINPDTGHMAIFYNKEDS